MHIPATNNEFRKSLTKHQAHCQKKKNRTGHRAGYAGSSLQYFCLSGRWFIFFLRQYFCLWWINFSPFRVSSPLLLLFCMYIRVVRVSPYTYTHTHTYIWSVVYPNSVLGCPKKKNWAIKKKNSAYRGACRRERSCGHLRVLVWYVLFALQGIKKKI